MSVGGITSSRCTNEETYLVQKLVRAAFGNNNVDTCARVCHSPTGYGLKHTLGRVGGHAGVHVGDEGRRDHRDRREPDRRPSGVRVAAQAPIAPGREADRDRSARDRAGAHAARRGRLSPAAAARHECRADECVGARRRHGRAGERRVHRRSLRSGRRIANGKSSSPHPDRSPEATAERHRRAGRAGARRGAPVRESAATARSITASA